MLNCPAMWWMQRLAATALVCASILLPRPALAQEPNSTIDERHAAIAKALETPVSVELLDTPFSRALEYVQRQAKVNVVIDPQRGGQFMGTPITLNLDRVTARECLDLICLTAEAGWMIEKGVVFVTTAAEIRRRNLQTRVYDIRSLMVSIQNQIGPTFDLNDALSNTNSGGSSTRMARSSGTGGSIFGDADEEDRVEYEPTPAEKIDMIVTLIQDSVGSPEEWIDRDSTLRAVGGQLVIRTTAQNHEQISKLLSMLETGTGRLVAIESICAVIPSATLDRFLAENDRQLVLDSAQIDELLKPTQDVRILGRTRNVGYNGQRVYIYAGNDVTFLSDVEPVPDTAGVDPTISLTRHGLVMDVLPTITLDGDEVIIAINSDVVTDTAAKTKQVPVGGWSGGRDLSLHARGPLKAKSSETGDGKPQRTVELEGNTSMSGSIQVPPSGPPAMSSVELDLLSKSNVAFRTTTRVPKGGGVLLAGSSEHSASVDASKSEVVLILRVRVVE